MTAEESSTTNSLADPESLLGMLQRGRGKGYLLALERPPEEVWPLLTRCATNCATMDFWVGDGSDFYAALMDATRMDLEPIRSCLKENEDADRDFGREPGITELGIPLGTLAVLANKGNSQAMHILKEYVSFGRRWSQVILQLNELDVPGALDSIDEILHQRISSDDTMRAQFTSKAKEQWDWYCQHDPEARAKSRWLMLPMCEPWKTLCHRNSGLANMFADVGIAFDQAPPPPEKITAAKARRLSLEETFAQVDESNWARLARFIAEKVSGEDEEYLLQKLSSDNRYRIMLAFRGLGHIGTAKAFETVKSFIEAGENADQGILGSAFRAFGEMPSPLTLETARIWFQKKERHLHLPAGSVLREHATHEDVPMLIEALRSSTMVPCGESRLPNILGALARFPGIGQIPELDLLFAETGEYFDRCRAAETMDIVAPLHFQHHYAFECLWDCYGEIRELGCETVSLTIPGALERLKELAADEDEYDNVREAAERRLEGF